MRVTGGQWRGRRLVAVPGPAVRPTTDRVREALFSMLEAEVRGAVVADLCCGSGALGLDALSRGAAHVDFVDLAPASLNTVRANLRSCEATPGTWRLHRAEAVRWLARRLATTGPPLLVLADPPYGGPVAAAMAVTLAAAPPGRLVAAALEHASDLAWPEVGSVAGPWRRDTRRYGRTTLTLLRPAATGVPEDGHA